MCLNLSSASYIFKVRFASKYTTVTSQKRNDMENEGQLDWLFYNEFRLTTTTTSKLGITGCDENPAGPAGSPCKWPVMCQQFPFYDGIMTYE